MRGGGVKALFRSVRGLSGGVASCVDGSILAGGGGRGYVVAELNDDAASNAFWFSESRQRRASASGSWGVMTVPGYMPRVSSGFFIYSP